MRKFIFIIIAIITWSCQEEELLTFGDRHFISFEKYYMDETHPGKNQADSTATSFFFYPSTTTKIDVPLIIDLNGKPLVEDRKYSIKVITNIEDANLYTTALPSEYEIAKNYTFKANNFNENSKKIQDTLIVKLIKSERMSSLNKNLKLVIELVPTDFLELGQYEKRRAVICFSAVAAKPIWWTSSVTQNLLGEFSVKKYGLFLQHADTQSEMSEDLIKANPARVLEIALKFKEWLINQNPAIKEDDGTEMTIKI